VLNVRGDVDILLFPVKLWVRRASVSARTALSGFASLAVFMGGCGYGPAESAAGAERLCVSAAPSKVPDFGALQATLDGAREELSRHGALADGDQYPCLRIELLRVDEAPAGIAAIDVGGARTPRARGTAVALVGRAWVERAEGFPISRDTGDMRRAARLQTSSGVLEGVRHDRGLDSAALELGRDLVRRVLGLPTPSDELP
jgi:hypothetical protein